MTADYYAKYARRWTFLVGAGCAVGYLASGKDIPGALGLLLVFVTALAVVGAVLNTAGWWMARRAGGVW